MSFTDKRGRKWLIATVADIPFPTRVGGSTPNCPLLAVCKQLHEEHGEEPTSEETLNALKAWPESEVMKCWHHHLAPDDQRYAAEVSCSFVENEVEPRPDAIREFVKQRGHTDDVADAVIALFEEPIQWTFQSGEQLINGQHRLCAMKASDVKRVVVEV